MTFDTLYENVLKDMDQLTILVVEADAGISLLHKLLHSSVNGKEKFDPAKVFYLKDSKRQYPVLQKVLNVDAAKIKDIQAKDAEIHKLESQLAYFQQPSNKQKNAQAQIATLTQQIAAAKAANPDAIPPDGKLPTTVNDALNYLILSVLGKGVSANKPYFNLTELLDAHKANSSESPKTRFKTEVFPATFFPYFMQYLVANKYAQFFDYVLPADADADFKRTGILGKVGGFISDTYHGKNSFSKVGEMGMNTL